MIESKCHRFQALKFVWLVLQLNICRCSFIVLYFISAWQLIIISPSLSLCLCNTFISTRWWFAHLSPTLAIPSLTSFHSSCFPSTFAWEAYTSSPDRTPSTSYTAFGINPTWPSFKFSRYTWTCSIHINFQNTRCPKLASVKALLDCALQLDAKISDNSSMVALIIELTFISKSLTVLLRKVCSFELENVKARLVIRMNQITDLPSAILKIGLCATLDIFSGNAK